MTVNCYQCKREGVVGGSKYFPFCCGKCKKKWGSENRAGVGKKRQKYQTIVECQKRIKEWREVFKTIVIPEVEKPKGNPVLF